MVSAPKATGSPDSHEVQHSDAHFVSIFTALNEAVLSANALPGPDQMNLLRTLSSPIRFQMDRVLHKILQSNGNIARLYQVKVPSPQNTNNSNDSFTSLSQQEELSDQTTETIEHSLEQFNIALDEARGIEDATVAPSGGLAPSDAVKMGLVKQSQKHPMYLNIEKPQIHFPDYPLDNSDTPFIPPYVSSTKSSSQGPNSHDSVIHHHLQDLYVNNSTSSSSTRHPYDEEITSCVADFASRTFNDEQTTVYGSLEDTPCTFVCTEHQLADMTQRLQKVSEIAVDIENHSMRSFQGFTCLIQISTRREDFIVDALALRGTIHRFLAPVFADDSIVKVMHGADKDVQWLERDFGIYVVGLFDTGQAARVLHFPSAGLAYLLIRFCSVKSPSKSKYQRADWRIRPLPDDMFAYARSDTHYLLYIYDRLRSDLTKRTLLQEVWERSGTISRKRHSKIPYNAGMARQLAARHGLGYDQQQIRLLESLCRWRDVTAREEDESLVYVAPLETLYVIAGARDRARTVEGIRNLKFPRGAIPPLIEEHVAELSQLVVDALDAKHEDEGTANDDLERQSAMNVSTKEPGQNALLLNIKAKERVSIFKQNKVQDPIAVVKGKEDGILVDSRPEVSMLENKGGLDQSFPPGKEIGMASNAQPVIEITRRQSSSFQGWDEDSSSDDEADSLNGEPAKTYSGSQWTKVCAREINGDNHNTGKSAVNDVVGSALKKGKDNNVIEPSFTMTDPDVDSRKEENVGRQSTDGSAELRMDVVSEVKNELVASIRGDKNDAIRRLEVSETEKQLGAGRKAKAKCAEKEPSQDVKDDDEIAFKSLLESCEQETTRKRKRKNKPREKVEEPPEPSEPFDYEKMLQKGKQKEEDEEDVFDPLRKLRPGFRGAERPVKKRKTGRGRSMTFRPNQRNTRSKR